MNSAPHWDQYWKSGQLHSCFSSGQPVDFSAVWEPLFGSLGEGARVLDLACGAGAVARAARDAGRGFEVVGVDFATEITPVEGVRFVLGTSIEALPFAAASFDAVVSQYGFEYADPARAAPEAVRVLAPGGKLALIVHASEGPPVRDVVVRLARARAFLADDGFAQQLKRLGEALASGQATDELVQEVERARLAAARADHDNTTRRALAVLSDAFVMRRVFGPAHVVGTANGMIAELVQYCARLGEMTGAALTEQQALALAERFSGLGLRVQPLEAARADNEDLLGWVVRGDRSV